MAPDIRQFLKKTHQTFKAFRGKVDAMKHDQEKEMALHPVSLEKARQKVEFTVSGKTIAKFVSITILLLLLTGFLYEIRDILVIFFVSLLFSAALDPMVDALNRRKIPRILGVLIIYIIIFFFLGLFISNLVPIIAREVADLAIRTQDFILNLVNGKIDLPQSLEGMRPFLKRMFEGVDISQIGSYKDVLLKFADNLSGVAGNVFNGIIALFNGLLNTTLIFVLTFLMTVDEQGIDKFILSLFPSRYADYIRQKSNAVKEKMGYWLRGQVILCVVVGSLVYIGFLLIGLFVKDVHYGATIAMLAGLMEVIPYAGPIIAWLIALPVVANQSLALVIYMTALMYIVQLLENNLIVPMVMHKAVGISPILVMLAMLVGFSFLGILGMVLSIPVATGVAIFLKDYSDKEK